MSVELLTITLAAGETKRFEKAGAYLEIIESSYPVKIDLYDKNGSDTDGANSAVSGLFLQVDYSAFMVTSANAQTITLLITDGSGGSRRQPGNVRVIDEITDDIVSLSYGPPLPITAGTQFVEVLAPSANLYGLILRCAYTLSVSGAGGSCSTGWIMAKSMPVNSINPVQQYRAAAAFSQNGAVSEFFDQKMNKKVPPGWGIYYSYRVDVAAAASLSVLLQYEPIKA